MINKFKNSIKNSQRYLQKLFENSPKKLSNLHHDSLQKTKFVPLVKKLSEKNTDFNKAKSLDYNSFSQSLYQLFYFATHTSTVKLSITKQ